MYLSAAAHLATILPLSRCVGMEGTARTKLALAEGIYRSTHSGIVWWAEALKDTLKTGGVGQSPAIISIVAEAQTRYIGITAGTQHRQAVDAIKHPAAQSHRLLHQHASIGSGGKFGGAFCMGVLIEESER